jgi:hypothetical protein
VRCRKKPALANPRGLCRKCFILVIERTALRNLRENKGFSDSSAEGAIVKHLARGSSRPGKSLSLEAYGALFLESLFANRSFKAAKSPLRNITHGECVEYARIKGLKFKEQLQKNDVLLFLSAIESRRTGSGFALMKSIEKILSP